MARKPKPPGSINAYARSVFWLGELRGEFDGTTLDLVRQAARMGAQAGAVVRATFGGLRKENAREMRIVSAPHDRRAGGLWAESNRRAP